MLETVITVVLTIIGYQLLIFWLWHRQQQRKLAVLQTIDKIADELKKTVYIEIAGDQLLAYDVKTHAFLTKFDNLQDLSAKLEKLDNSAIWMMAADSLKAYKEYLEQKNVRQETNPV